MDVDKGDMNVVEENMSSYRKRLPFNSIKPATFESLEEDRRLYSLKLSGVERLAYLKQLNINAFGKKSLLIKDFGKKIIER